MWRLRRDDPERGVVAPLTALLMVVLLGMAAFAIDVASMYSEHAQLQNGADAAALAIAQACAKSTSSADCSGPGAAATALAGSNALDGVTNVPVATVNLGTGTVDVTTQSRDTSGNNHFSLVFARAIGIQTADIKASAQAKFGGYAAGNVFPLAFSHCEADPTFSKGMQFFPEHGNAMATQPGYECITSSSSGQEVPGGFGWLDHTSGQCTSNVNINNPWVGTNEGTNFDSDCSTLMSSWGAILSDPTKTVDILVPIFDNARGTGSNAQFHIEAFAQISIRGWNLDGGSKLPGDFMTPDATAYSKSLKLKNSDNGIFGYFIKKVSLAEAATMGGPTTYGALGAQLTK